jgi:parallel beta-helix repeat protein
MKTCSQLACATLLLSLGCNTNVAAAQNPVSMTTYYISSTSGNDHNGGKSPKKAWQHLSRIFLQSTSTTPFQPGDNILLKRGDQWDGQIRIQAHGADHHPVTIGAYGEGPKPLLYGNDQHASWEPVLGHAGIYKTDMGAGSVLGAIVLDGQMIRTIYPAGSVKRQEDMDMFLARLQPGILAGQFEGRLWIRTADGRPPNEHIRVFRLAGVALFDSSYVQIEDLDIERFYTGIDIENSQQVIVSHNDVQDVLGIGIYLRSSDTDCQVESNTVFRSGNTALYVLKGSHNTFRDNWVSHVNTSILGIKVHGDGMGVGLQESQHSLVEHNYFAYTGGIDFYYEQGSTVRYNYLYRVRSPGAPHGVNLSIYGNIYNLSGPQGQSGSRGLNAVATGPGTIAIFNNTIFNASAFFLMGSSIKGGKIVFSDNIAASTVADSTMAVFGANVASNHNCFFTPSKPAFSYTGTEFSSLKAYQAASGLDPDSVFSDPQFLSAVPIAPLDFRISPRSGCNSPASNVPFADLADGRTYDHDRGLSDTPAIGALRINKIASQADRRIQSCISQCFGHQFAVPSGVYLVRLRFAPAALRKMSKISFVLNGRRLAAEFEHSASADSDDTLSRYFLVRSDSNSIILSPITNTDTALVTGVDIQPFDTSHGNGPQVIPW